MMQMGAAEYTFEGVEIQGSISYSCLNIAFFLVRDW
jgi:hypothetical protein